MAKMRNLHCYERAAMWLWSEEYAKGHVSAIEFYRQLSETRKGIARRMADEIRAAKAPRGGA
mgnify:FL=1